MEMNQETPQRPQSQMSANFPNHKAQKARTRRSLKRKITGIE